MSEMIDRVGRAIAVASGRGNTPRTAVNIQAENGYAWLEYLVLARAAIEAMREPTEKMAEAAGGGHDEVFQTEEYMDAWRDMVDEALR